MGVLEDELKEIVRAISHLRRGLLVFLIGLSLLIFCWYTLFMYTVTGSERAPLWLGALGYAGFAMMLISIRDLLDARVKTSFKDPQMEENPTIQQLKLLREAYQEGVIDAEEYYNKRNQILKQM